MGCIGVKIVRKSFDLLTNFSYANKPVCCDGVSLPCDESRFFFNGDLSCDKILSIRMIIKGEDCMAVKTEEISDRFLCIELHEVGAFEENYTGFSYKLNCVMVLSKRHDSYCLECRQKVLAKVLGVFRFLI
ncbi:hypothetical protein CAPTEDRAFT_207010 [Capitella teleta]|uniref:Uncharacterized protein n=1 Tax=Capitella teleta TaxID=283909 RepID=R7UQX0_CAPTE|nr:hypothetical protein CAPTEDRAFT_207010 [Capitella teleta]|eukprot:ELU08934.1 hypothetical protein CAPTEDRAFT_207010 [Capitella teleta]